MAAVSYAVDVSNNQAAHQPWRSFGAHLGFAKASEGQRSRDDWFPRHIADIKAGGLIPAGYHFAWPNQSAVLEAGNYASVVRSAAAASPLFVHALDLERYPDGARNYVGASSAQVRQYAHDWIAKVKAAFPGQRVGIYTSGDDILDGHLPGNEDFLWYPAYPVQGRTFQQAAAATRPSPSGHTVWGWQFASVPRDQTVIYMSPAALHAWAAGGSTVQEDDMALTQADYTAIGKEAAKAIAAAMGAPAGVLARIDNPTVADDPKNPTGDDESVRALWWDTGMHAGRADANSAAILQLLKSGLPATLTGDQITALADRLAADPTFAAALGRAIGADLAARVQS